MGCGQERRATVVVEVKGGGQRGSAEMRKGQARGRGMVEETPSLALGFPSSKRNKKMV